MAECTRLDEIQTDVRCLNVLQKSLVWKETFPNTVPARTFYSEGVSEYLTVRENETLYGKWTEPQSADFLKEQWETYRRILKRLTIMSDAFMRNVFKKKECTEYILRIIMGNRELEVVEQVIQKDYKNLQGRSAILDCVARDADEMYSEVLAERVRELKETQEGVTHMCRELEMLYEDGVKLGEQRGEMRGEKRGERKERLRNILYIVRKMKLSPDEAMDILEIEPDEREMYRKEIQE